MFDFLKKNKSPEPKKHGASQPASDWYLVDETHKQAYKLCHEPAFIGRDRYCQVHIDDQFLSRRHARIDYGKNNCVITDLNTINGLEVDGQFVENGEQTLLEENSRIKIANTSFFITRRPLESGIPVTDLAHYHIPGGKAAYYNPDADAGSFLSPAEELRLKNEDRTILLSGNFGFEDTMYFSGIGTKNNEADNKTPRGGNNG